MLQTHLAATMNLPTDLGVVPFTEVTIPSDPAEARRFQEEIEQQLAATKATEQEVFSIRLALEEALVNAIKHGNQMDRSRKVRIAYRFLPDRFEIHITDEGTASTPRTCPTPPPSKTSNAPAAAA